MAGPRSRPANKRAVLIATSVAIAFGAPQPSHAQGLFDLLFGVLRGAAPQAYNREPPPRLLENVPGVPRDGERVTEDSSGGPYVSYCVRTCDGRYFPLSASSRGSNASPASLCSAMCPSAETKVYSGSSIDTATSDGKPYRALKNAFLYREKAVTDCTCNGRDTNGTARIDPREDPTLRPGDIIVTAEGPLVFKGRGGKRGASEFVSAKDDRSLPKRLRTTLSEMRIAPSAPAATATSGAPVEGRAAGTAAPDTAAAQEPKAP